MCIFANEGGPKSKSSRKETPLKIKKYKEKHVSGKNLEKMFSAPTPTIQPANQLTKQPITHATPIHVTDQEPNFFAQLVLFVHWVLRL